MFYSVLGLTRLLDARKLKVSGRFFRILFLVRILLLTSMNMFSGLGVPQIVSVKTDSLGYLNEGSKVIIDRILLAAERFIFLLSRLALALGSPPKS